MTIPTRNIEDRQRCGYDHDQSIPIHLMNYMDDRLKNHGDRMGKIVGEHIADELDKYDQIINKINANNTVSDERHDETQSRINHLTQSIEAFITESQGFHVEVKRAFLKDEEGKPGYDGHRLAHQSWVQNVDRDKKLLAYVERQMDSEKDSKELIQHVKKVVIAAAVVAVVSFVAIATWASFVKGPY